MRIFFITQWYYPEPDGRVSSLAEALAEKGYEITVVTGFPNYPKGKIYNGYKVKLYQREIINRVSVVRLPIFPDHSQSKFKRILNYFSFSVSLFLLAPWFIKKPDVFWAYTPFVVLPTLFFKIIFRKSYVLEITDIWPDTIFASGMVKEGVFSNILKKIADTGYRHATAITLQNLGFEKCLINRGVEHNKLHVIENWADESIFYPAEYNKNLASENKMKDKFNIVFAGNMGIAQGLDNIIDTAILLKDTPDIQFVFIGDGACLKDIKQKVEDENIKNVQFIDRKPLNEMANFFAISDILLVSLRDEPLFEITLPSKTQAYLACGKPILIIKRGDDAKMLSDYGCARQCLPSRPEDLAKIIFQMYKMDEKERKLMGELGLKLYRERYKKEKLVNKMEQILISAT